VESLTSNGAGAFNKNVDSSTDISIWKRGNVMAKSEPSRVNGEIEMPKISNARWILVKSDKHLIKGLIKIIHSFLEGASSKQLLRMTESEESDPSGSWAGGKFGLIQNDTEKESAKRLSDEFSKFLDKEHGDTEGHCI